MSINRAILLGHVGGDPTIRTTQGGDRVASFSLATSESWTDKATGEKKESTEWHRITVFNQVLIDRVVEKFVRKGGKLAVEGQIKTRKYQAPDGSDRYATEIVVGRFDGSISLEGAPKAGPGDEHAYGQTRDKPAGTPPSTRMVDDDIPF